MLQFFRVAFISLSTRLFFGTQLSTPVSAVGLDLRRQRLRLEAERRERAEREKKGGVSPSSYVEKANRSLLRKGRENKMILASKRAEQEEQKVQTGTAADGSGTGKKDKDEGENKTNVLLIEGFVIIAVFTIACIVIYVVCCRKGAQDPKPNKGKGQALFPPDATRAKRKQVVEQMERENQLNALIDTRNQLAAGGQQRPLLLQRGPSVKVEHPPSAMVNDFLKDEPKSGAGVNTSTVGTTDPRNSVTIPASANEPPSSGGGLFDSLLSGKPKPAKKRKTEDGAAVTTEAVVADAIGSVGNVARVSGVSTATFASSAGAAAAGTAAAGTTSTGRVSAQSATGSATAAGRASAQSGGSGTAGAQLPRGPSMTVKQVDVVQQIGASSQMASQPRVSNSVAGIAVRASQQAASTTTGPFPGTSYANLSYSSIKMQGIGATAAHALQPSAQSQFSSPGTSVVGVASGGPQLLNLGASQRASQQASSQQGTGGIAASQRGSQQGVGPAASQRASQQASQPGVGPVASKRASKKSVQ